MSNRLPALSKDDQLKRYMTLLSNPYNAQPIADAYKAFLDRMIRQQKIIDKLKRNCGVT